MATFKIIVKKAKADGYYPVYIRMTHNRKLSYIPSGKTVDAKGLTKAGEVKDVYVLKFCTDKISHWIEKLNMVDYGKWDSRQIVSYLTEESRDLSFSEYARKFIFKMRKGGMERNAKNYSLALSNLELYAGTNNLPFSRLTSQLINGWIESLSHTNRAKEMYPICVRQMFKEACIEYNDYDNGNLRIKTNPWVRIKIPKADIPEKRAIAPDAVRSFFSAPLPESKLKSPLSELGRDVALMVMCLAGINTADIWTLEKSRCSDGVIRYNRAKTKKFRADKAYMEIKIPGILKPVIEKYKDTTDSPYLLNFHQRLKTQDSFNANVNTGIKQICESMGLEQKYCVYTFRHTWGTVAQNYCGATMEEIAFAMNHASAHKVTEGYVKRDYSPISDLNQKVIDFLFFNAPEKQPEKDTLQEEEFRVSPKYQIKAAAYFKGRTVAQLCDIGFNNKEEVISKLVEMLPGDIPNRSIVLFRLENTDKDTSAIYERQKGKGF